ncbi:MAG: ribosomal-processing cysteine protease Prp [Spirochaetales bacterium]
MIEVSLTLQDRCATRLELQGHASSRGGPLGNNVVCAAVTSLVRSFADALLEFEQEHGTLGVTGRAERPGELLIEVKHPDAAAEWLGGATASVVAGIGRIANEYPEEVTFLVQGDQHGS